MKNIKFKSISPFREIVYTVRDTCQFTGMENGKAQFDTSIKLPSVLAFGTEKIHGTFGGVCKNATEMWVQSRNNIITVEKDHAGFAQFVSSKSDAFEIIINQLAYAHSIDLNDNTIMLCGEWAGDGIQKKSALTGVEKCFTIFHFMKVIPNDEDTPSYYKETNALRNPRERIYNVMDSAMWQLDIDFNNTQPAIDKMKAIVEEHELHSPRGISFGKEDNIMEGVVWSFMYMGELYQWKVRGEKHNTCRVKTIKHVNEEEENKKIDFVNNHGCTASRLEQGLTEVFGFDQQVNIKKTGEFIKWMSKDILKEEKDILDKLEIPWKKIAPLVAKAIAQLVNGANMNIIENGKNYVVSLLF